MKEGQEQFLTFILDRTKEDKKEKMQALLAEMFERQQTGKLDKMYLMIKAPKLLAYLKPEAIDEVKQVVSEFSKNMK
ncbi:hypothetical protein FBR87_000614 [Enterococcus faecalis]|nr:hypothetical protein [Enterococcus faecalis]